MSDLDGVSGNRAQRRAASRRSKKMMAVGSGALLVAGVAGPGGLLTASVASAATFTVTNTDDSGVGSLRQAIEDAEANAGEDVITFATGVTGDIALSSGLFTMTETVDIVGPGADLLTIEANGFETFQFDGPSVGVISISGLTINGSYGELGGAIGLYSAGAALEVTDVVITGSTAGDEGGGIGVDTDGDGAAPFVTITDTVISGNTSGSGGGGVYFDADSSDESALTVTNSSISDNEAGGGGGGLYTEDVTVQITASTISGNTAYSSGGGLYLSRGPVTIESSFISGNMASNYGGGVYINGEEPFTLENSTVADNTAGSGGGGVYASNGGSFTMRNSTVSGNTAESYGGGLYLSGPAVIENSTISGNTASQAGGIYGSYGGLTIIQSTITDNEAVAPDAEPAVGGVQLIGGSGSTGTSKSAAVKAGKPDKASTGSRPAAATPGQLEVVGTIIAGNVGQDIGVYVEAEATVTSDHSILGVVDPLVTVTDLGGTQLDVADPGLAPLASNGGPTQTHALLDGSVALNAGPDPVPSFPGNEFDQRGPGFARVAFGLVDVGAFEAQEDEPVVPPAPVPDAAPADEVLVTPTFTG